MAAPSPQAKHSLTQTATNRLAAPRVRRLFTFAYLSPLSLPLVYCFLHSSFPLLFGNFHEKCRSYMVHDIADAFDYTTIWQERMSRKLQNLPLSPSPINPSVDFFRFCRATRFIGIKLNRSTFRGAQWVSLSGEQKRFPEVARILLQASSLQATSISCERVFPSSLNLY